MIYPDWIIRGLEISTCNCNWGCPCQFNSIQTHGHCRAGVAMRIEAGHYGDSRLDGLLWYALFATVPDYIDANASPIANSVTGERHRARAFLPHGFESREAEFVSSHTHADGPIPLDWTDGHGHIAMIHMTPAGPVGRLAASVAVAAPSSGGRGERIERRVRRDCRVVAAGQLPVTSMAWGTCLPVQAGTGA
jgi:hypothetical protein